MASQKLTDATAKQASAKDKDYKLSDGGGLYLLVKTNGSKCWRYAYRFDGKQKTLALGIYPAVTLKNARDAMAKAKEILSTGTDPGRAKQEQKRKSILINGNQFSVLAVEWWEHQKGTWTEGHASRILGRLEMDVFPYLGNRAITDISPQDVIAVVRRIESRDALDVASRVLQDIRRVCRYAVQTGRLTHNPAIELADILKGRKEEHRPSLPREELPAFLRDLETYDMRGRLITKLAIKLLLLTFVRSGELRGARWEEFNLEEKLWRIPAHRMKMKTEHLVPLSKQAIRVLEQIRPISGQYDLVFPSERERTDCMSDATLLRAIYRLGYDGKTAGKTHCVPHGFRATASSILNEQGFNPDAIERQLAHLERNGVRAAYTHHARYLDDRAKMMQWWADYLDAQRAQDISGNVIAANFGNTRSRF
jgi:integrase